MKQLILFQPLVFLIAIITILGVNTSMIVAVGALIAVLGLLALIAYGYRNAKLRKIKRYIADQNVQTAHIIPITKGMLGINALSFEADTMRCYSSAAKEWDVDYTEVTSVDADINGLKYQINLTSGEHVNFSLHPLKSKKDIFDGLTNPRLAVGALGAATLPALGSVSALHMSTMSNARRVYAINDLLGAVLPPNTPITTANSVGFNIKDTVVGMLVLVEILIVIFIAYSTGFLKT